MNRYKYLMLGSFPTLDQRAKRKLAILNRPTNKRETEIIAKVKIKAVFE